MTDAPPLSRGRRLGSTDLLMLSATVIWAVNFTVVKLALREFHPLVFNALRFSLATLVMLGILWRRGRGGANRGASSILRRDWGAVLLLGLCGHTLYQLLFINGLAHTTPANSSLLMGTAPIWVAIIGLLLGIERINRAMWAGILTSFSGIALLILSGNGGVQLGGATFLGDLMLLGCVILWAGYTTASKPLLARYSPLELTAWSMLAGTIPLALIALPAMARQDWAGLSPLAWGAMLFSALFAVVIGYLIWYTSVQRVGNARTAIYSNLTPVIAIIVAWLVLGDALSWRQLLGAVIVLAGLIITRRGRTR